MLLLSTFSRTGTYFLLYGSPKYSREKDSLILHVELRSLFVALVRISVAVMKYYAQKQVVEERVYFTLLSHIGVHYWGKSEQELKKE